jgi:hypothetical protein
MLSTATGVSYVLVSCVPLDGRSYAGQVAPGSLRWAAAQRALRVALAGCLGRDPWDGGPSAGTAQRRGGAAVEEQEEGEECEEMPLLQRLKRRRAGAEGRGQAAAARRAVAQAEGSSDEEEARAGSGLRRSKRRRVRLGAGSVATRRRGRRASADSAGGGSNSSSSGGESSSTGGASPGEQTSDRSGGEGAYEPESEASSGGGGSSSGGDAASSQGGAGEDGEDEEGGGAEGRRGSEDETRDGGVGEGVRAHAARAAAQLAARARADGAWRLGIPLAARDGATRVTEGDVAAALRVSLSAPKGRGVARLQPPQPTLIPTSPGAGARGAAGPTRGGVRSTARRAGGAGKGTHGTCQDAQGSSKADGEPLPCVSLDGLVLDGELAYGTYGVYQSKLPWSEDYREIARLVSQRVDR